jgi:hypothetical protein
MKIYYLDTFCPEHSGRFWLQAFRQHGEVQIQDVCEVHDTSSVLRQIIAFAPDIIHFGGSTQSEKTFTINDIYILKQKTQAKVTFFYGDAYYRVPFYAKIADIVDEIYVTNYNMCDNPKIHYTLCPAPQEFSTQCSNNEAKECDIVFVGNNYDSKRREMIYRIHKTFSGRLTVFGKGWKSRRVNTKGPLSYSNTNRIYQKSRIILGDPAGSVCFYSNRDRCEIGDPDLLHHTGCCRSYQCSRFTELQGYASNRVSNILIAGGGICIIPYNMGLDNVLKPNRHLLVYRNWNDLEDILTNLPLNHEEIVKNGQRLMFEHYTFEALVKKIIRK